VSGIINALGVLVISLVLLPVFSYLALPVIAAILSVVALRMLEIDEVIHLFQHDRKMFAICLLTAFIVIVDEPTNGVLAGAIVSLLIFAHENSKGHGEAVLSQRTETIATLSIEELDHVLKDHHVLPSDEIADTLILRLTGELTFLNAPGHVSHAKVIARSHCSSVLVSLRYVFAIDVDGLDALKEITELFEKQNKRVFFKGAHGNVRGALEHMGWYREKLHNGQVFHTYQEAAAALNRLATAAAGRRNSLSLAPVPGSLSSVGQQQQQQQQQERAEGISLPPQLPQVAVQPSTMEAV
jgi:MFS superfamily sulfate permease-like transporter